MKNKCRNLRKHTLKVRENELLQKISEKNNLKKMKMVREKRNGNEKRK